MSMDQAIADRPYFYSHLAGDADLQEIVEMFVEEMPGRVATLLRQLHDKDWDNLQRTAHQLKGAAGSYGFDAISPCAGKVESAIRNGESERQIHASIAELIDMCDRIRAGKPEA